MDSSELYVLCVAGIFVARLFYSSYNFIPREWKVNTRVWLRRHLFYVLLPRWLAFRTVTTRFDVLLHFLFISGNICAVTIGSDSSKDLADRLGRAALMNLIFLCLGYKTNIILDKCNIRLDRFAGLHRLAGVVMTLEAVLHSAFAGLGKTFTLSSHTTGLLVRHWQAPFSCYKLTISKALCAIGAIVVFSLPILSDRVYDLSAFIHTSLVVLVLVSLLLHVPGPSISQRPRLYALISILVFVTVKLLRYIGIMLASMSSKHLYIATIERVPGGTEVRVRVPSHWKLRAGQYIYLRVCGLSTFSLFQSHPFQVSWTYPDGASHKVIVLLIQARKGFTRRLLLADSGRQYPVLLDGPYGRHLGHEDYGTVLLFASGIGIAGQLPFARELLELYYDCRVKTRRVALFWEISEEGMWLISKR